MPVPNSDSAYVPPVKLSDYLLDEQHPTGGSKAIWFRSLGYETASPAVLEQDLLKQLQASENYTMKSSPFGIKYVVAGKISAPNGVQANVTTVWIIEPPDDRPRLVTAYPGVKP